MTPDSSLDPNDDVVLIIPVYNEGRVAKETIEAIPEIFPNIICINDGSKDNTLEYLMESRADVLSHAINLGQGAALQTGLEYALLNPKFNYYVTYDADGQHNIADVKKMVKHIKSQGKDIVLGSRFLGSAKNMPLLKKKLLKAAIRFSNVTSGLQLTDAHNGLRVMNRYAASVMQLQMHDFSHASEIIERIAEKKLNYAEMPVVISYTTHSLSKGQSMINSINISFDLLLNKLIKR